MFAFYNKHNNTLYNKLIELSRNIFFYKELKLKDNFETRIILMFMHFSVILLIFKNERKNNFPQKIFDNIFLNIEYHLRELGHGDVSVNKKMKLLTKIFYDILLKIKHNNSDKFEVNKELVKKQLFANNVVESEYLTKFSIYLRKFYDFCFDIDDNIMIEGDINFKY